MSVIKARILLIAAAALMLSGCTLNSSGSSDSSTGSTAAEAPAEVVDTYVRQDIEVPVLLKKIEWREGGALRYSDFTANEVDYIQSELIDDYSSYSYTSWRGEDDEGNLLSIGSVMQRLRVQSTMEDVLKAYGEDALKEVDLNTDKLYEFAIELGNINTINMIEKSTTCAEYFYDVPGCADSFVNRGSLKFYFDDEGYIKLLAICFNEDLFPLYGYSFNSYAPKSYREVSERQAFDPEGRKLRVSVIMKDLFTRDEIRTDAPYPVYSFENGVVKATWYDFDGEEAASHPKSAFDEGVKYEFDGEGIVLDLSEGGEFNPDNTYFFYDKYLQCYQLCEPCWTDMGGTALIY